MQYISVCQNQQVVSLKLSDSSKKSHTVYKHFTKLSYYIMKSDPTVRNKSIFMSENDHCISYTFPISSHQMAI